MSNAPSKILHCGHFKFNRLFDTADIVMGELLQCYRVSIGAVVGWFREKTECRDVTGRLTLQTANRKQIVWIVIDMIF